MAHQLFVEQMTTLSFFAILLLFSRSKIFFIPRFEAIQNSPSLNLYQHKQTTGQLLENWSLRMRAWNKYEQH